MKIFCFIKILFIIKALVSGCIALVLNENVSESSHSVPRLDTPAFPKEFSRAVIKLVGRYLLAIKVCQSIKLNSLVVFCFL
jgi:hypothetical protein